MLRQGLAVYHRAKRSDASELPSQLWLNLEQSLKRYIRQGCKLSGLQTELCQQGLRDFGGLWTRHQVASSAALQDRAPEEPLCCWHPQQGPNAHRTRRLAHHRHLVGIASEGGDILAHPREGRDLIEQPAVTCIGRICSGQIFQRDKPQDSQPVVERHHDDVVIGGERRPVIPGIRRRAECEGSAVNVDHDRALLLVSARRPDVEVQAILAHRARLYGSLCSYRSYHACPDLRHLGRHGAKRGRLAHARPWLRRLRCPKTTLARGRLRERNAFPDADRALLAALYFSIPCLNN